MSYRLLCVSPFLMAIVGGLGALGVPSLRYPAAGALLLAILIAGWSLGARAITSRIDERRTFAVAGGFLVSVWALLPIIAAMGPPDLATVAENQIRYFLLLISALAIAAALVALAAHLREAGERFYSTLGFAAIMLAGPLYVIFTAIQLVEYRAAERSGTGQLPPGVAVLDQLSLILLFFAAILTYLATAAFVTALARIGWIGRRASRVYVTASLFAVLCVGVRVVEALASAQSPLWGFQHWYAIPGFVLLIPAVPWIMLSLIGMMLLRRAGDERRPSLGLESTAAVIESRRG